MNNLKPILALVFLCITFYAQSQNSSQWRGANREGIYTEENLLKAWPAEGPALLWSNEIGDGYGSPALTSDMLLVNGEIDSVSHVFAFDLSGKLLWKAPNGREFTGTGYSNKFPGSRSTPTIVDDLVYVCSGNGRVACLDRKTGKEKWSKDMKKDFGGISPEFGFSESLLVDKSTVYCFPGGAKNNAVALDRFSGSTVWTSPLLGDSVSYCSPMVIHLPARDILVSLTNYYLVGVDAKTGELLWSQKQENVKYKQQCNTPIYSNGYLYYVAGDGNGAVKLELSADGKAVKEVWRSSVSNNFNGIIKFNDYLYSGDRTQKLRCIDINTGKTLDSLKMNRGSVIAADGMLYTYSENGDVNLVKTTGSKMESVGKFKVEKGTREHFAHPVISKGVLYIRHGKILMAYNIKK
jgi:outer membrane protein assembly factor BamB